MSHKSVDGDVLVMLDKYSNEQDFTWCKQRIISDSSGERLVETLVFTSDFTLREKWFLNTNSKSNSGLITHRAICVCNQWLSGEKIS